MKAVRERMYGAPTARERERWHAIWLMSRGMTAAQVGEALERDAHTIGGLENLRDKGPTALGACMNYLHRLGFVVKRPKYNHI